MPGMSSYAWAERSFPSSVGREKSSCPRQVCSMLSVLRMMLYLLNSQDVNACGLDGVEARILKAFPYGVFATYRGLFV